MNTTNTQDPIKLALEKIAKAHEVVAALCEGTQRWTMSVPARVDSDPDLVISAALRHAEAALLQSPAPQPRNPYAAADAGVYGPEYQGQPPAPQPQCAGDYRMWYEDAMRASNEAGFAGLSAGETIRELTRQLAEVPSAPQPKSDAREAFEVVECIEQPADARAPALLMVDGPIVPIGTRLQAAQTSEPSAAPEFTVDDPDLNALLNATAAMVEGNANHDTGMWFLQSLEKVQARLATPAQASEPSTAKFKLGDTVRKTKGSQWHGIVVGTYSTELTPEGYAVESSTEKGSVQIYPAAALEAAPARAVEPISDEKLLALWSGGDERFMRPVLGKNKVLAFARAIERAHGIGIPATTPTQAAQGGEA